MNVPCEFCGAPLFLGRHCPNDPKRLDGTRARLPFTKMQRRHHGTRLLRQLDAIVAQHALACELARTKRKRDR